MCAIIIVRVRVYVYVWCARMLDARVRQKNIKNEDFDDSRRNDVPQQHHVTKTNATRRQEATH
jgi:hypothetical protein